MKTLRVPLKGLAPGERLLPEDAARYVLRVHRMSRGQRFVAFDPEARLECEAELLDDRRVRLMAPRTATLVATRSVTVIQCLAKAGKLDRVVREATELGATCIAPAESQRCAAKAHARQQARLERVALEAARQCGRGDVPIIESTQPLSQALRHHAHGTMLLLHPGATKRLSSVEEGPVVVAIGPEGGFNDDEIALATDLGFQSVRLGPFTLRTETACAAVLGALLCRD